MDISPPRCYEPLSKEKADSRALQKLKNYLFGDTGVANDGTLSTSDVSGMVKYIADVQSAVTSSSAVWDAVKQAAAESGINLSSTSTSSSGISASEQSLTENTGNILAGYIDNIRLDVAAISVKYDNLIVEIQSYSTTFSSMLTQLTEIKTNTAQIVTNTKAMGDLYDFVKNKLTIKNSGYGLNIN